VRRLLFVAAIPCVALAFAACGGGGDDDGGDDATPANGTPVGSLTPADTPPPTPESPIATPTRVAEDEPLLIVNFGATELLPTAADLAGMTQVEVIDMDGNDHSGVSLEALGQLVGAPAQGFVSLQGIRSDGIRYATVRFAIEEHAATTVLYVGESGNVEMGSSSIAPVSWVGAISAISFE
jgi:hypothetical protein